MNNQNPCQITIITPVYNEELCLDNYYETLTRILFTIRDVNFNVILVDDGSTDNSWQKIQEICKKSAYFQAIRLSRNFGSHIALSAGLDRATGDAVATLACDLQDPPEVILQFIEKWRQGAKIVWGRRRQRADKLWKIWTSHLFFTLLKKYAMPKNSQFCTGSFFLIDKEVVKCFRNFREHNRITFALVAWTGFEQETVLYDRQARFAGSSGWTFSLMLKTLGDAFVAFSNMPARMIIFLGVLIWIFSIFFGTYLIINYTISKTMPGWTGLALLIVTLFGTLFLMLGLCVEYLRRIYIEVTNRPLYFICKEIHSNIEENRAR